MKNFITFDINEHIIGVDILNVDKIMKLDKTSSIPSSSDYLEGVIEMGDLLIPAINLKKVFGFSPKDILPDSSVIVLSYEDKKYGIITDYVNDIIEINEANILKTETSKYIYAAVKVDDVIVKLLNLKSLIID